MNISAAMTYTQEKAFFGLSSFVATSISAVGAMVVRDDVLRYLYLTLTVSILTSAFLALVFRKSNERIGLVVGCCGLSILGGVFGTRMVMHHANLETANEDIIYLMGFAGGVTMASFIIGFVFIQLLEKRANSIAERILRHYGLAQPKDSDKDS